LLTCGIIIIIFVFAAVPDVRLNCQVIWCCLFLRASLQFLPIIQVLHNYHSEFATHSALIIYYPTNAWLQCELFSMLKPKLDNRFLIISYYW